MAFKLNGWEWAPVDVQDYDDDAMEYADMVADNALGAQSRMDKAKINEDIVKHGPELPIEMLGFASFTVEPADQGGGRPPNHGKNDTEDIKFTLLVESANIVRKAIHESGKRIQHDDSTGQDLRGTGLVHICEKWLEENLAE